MTTSLKKQSYIRSAVAVSATRGRTGLAIIGLAALLAGCSSMGMGMGGSTGGMKSGMQGHSMASLSSASEVPAVDSKATGSGMIMVAADHTVSGSISTTGIEATAAHIHLAAKGVNGPVIVPLTKAADGTWKVPEGARLTDAQYVSYMAGDTYVNVHSAANPGGEIRGQLMGH